MKTKVICSETELSPAVEAIRAGGLVSVPTETVYGLCANALDEKAVEELYEIKGRPEVKPLAMMVPSAEAMEKYCRNVPKSAYKLAENYWPGPLTIVLEAKEELVPSILRAGGKTVGLRCPDHPLTLAFLRECGLPLAGPSANPSGKPSPKSAGEVRSYFDGEIAAVLDGGECAIGRESTLISLASKPYKVLREAAVSEAELRRVLRDELFIIGVTGGTGCGKTTVLETLEESGALLLDCDKIYHELLKTSAEMLSAIEARFPTAFSGGGLDRKALGAIVFADPGALAELNAITHPFVAAEIERRLEEFAWNGGEVAAIDAIALIESGLSDRCDLTLGVLASREARCERIMRRDGISRDYAEARIDAQPSDDFYESHCGRILRNDGTAEELAALARALISEIDNN